MKTGGYQAEFGRRRRGRERRDEGAELARRIALFAYAGRRALERTGRTSSPRTAAYRPSLRNTVDGGAEGGGPIIRNKLFFFGAYDPSRSVVTLQAPDGFPLQNLGRVDKGRKSETYSTKLTWQINPTASIDASFFGDPSTGDMGANGCPPARHRQSRSVRCGNGGHNQT